MNEMVFHYFAAFVARIHDATKVQIWLQHPRSEHINYSLDKTITVDIAKTPSMCRQWEDIEVDDYAEDEDPSHRGFSTLGPVFPHHYGAVGVYLSLAYLSRHSGEIARATQPIERSRPGAGPHEYEYMAVAIRRPLGITRFHGFHCSPLQATSSGTLVTVSQPGASQSRRPKVRLVIHDLEQETFTGVVPPWNANLFRASSSTSLAEGPIYIRDDVAAAAGLETPKKPSGSGEGLIAEFRALSDQLQSQRLLGMDLYAARNQQKVAPVPGGPLNLFGRDPYEEVSAIQSRLNRNYCSFAPNAASLGEALDLAAQNQSTYATLDFIGHSRLDGVLRIENVPLTAQAWKCLLTSDIVDKIAALGVKEVRLLGCRTATEDGLDALRELEHLLQGKQIAVRGTVGDTFAVHYAHGAGFEESRLLSMKNPATRPAIAEHVQPPVSPQVPPTNFESGHFPPSSEGTSDADPTLVGIGLIAELASAVDTKEADGDPTAAVDSTVVWLDGGLLRAFDIIVGNQIRCTAKTRCHVHAIKDGNALMRLIEKYRDPRVVTKATSRIASPG